MDSPAHAPRGTASDSLLAQVNIDNVLQVRNVLHEQGKDITVILRQADKDLALTPPGQDLVSADAVPLFQAKIDQIKNLHWAHVRELNEVTERLRQAALHYGFTDEEIRDSFTAHDDAVGPIVDR